MSGSREYGQMGDAYAFAARLDWAIASNLNVWAGYLWAHRLERAGFLGGLVNETDSPAPVASQTAAVNWFALNGLPGHQPYVDDGYLGWEANAGVDWKLLENLTLNLRYAYWQPGPWFHQAYQAIRVRGGRIVRDGLLDYRAPINAFEGVLVIDF